MIEALAFYMFAGILLVSGAMVITARNPVHAVLFLILAFFNAAGLFVLLGAEYIAMTLVIVYVGAVAVLFLFVVMMLDINFKDLRKGAMAYVPLGGLVGAVLLTELFLIFRYWTLAPLAMNHIGAPTPRPDIVTNTHALGEILYTDMIFPFQMAGMILLVAMIGAITLTLRTRSGVHRQDAGDQVHRKRSDVIRIEKVPTGTGVS